MIEERDLFPKNRLEFLNLVKKIAHDDVKKCMVGIQATHPHLIERIKQARLQAAPNVDNRSNFSLKDNEALSDKNLKKDTLNEKSIEGKKGKENMLPSVNKYEEGHINYQEPAGPIDKNNRQIDKKKSGFSHSDQEKAKERSHRAYKLHIERYQKRNPPINNLIPMHTDKQVSQVSDNLLRPTFSIAQKQVKHEKKPEKKGDEFYYMQQRREQKKATSLLLVNNPTKKLKKKITFNEKDYIEAEDFMQDVSFASENNIDFSSLPNVLEQDIINFGSESNVNSNIPSTVFEEDSTKPIPVDNVNSNAPSTVLKEDTSKLDTENNVKKNSPTVILKEDTPKFASEINVNTNIPPTVFEEATIKSTSENNVNPSSPSNVLEEDISKKQVDEILQLLELMEKREEEIRRRLYNEYKPIAFITIQSIEDKKDKEKQQYSTKKIQTISDSQLKEIFQYRNQYQRYKEKIQKQPIVSSPDLLNIVCEHIFEDVFKEVLSEISQITDDLLEYIIDSEFTIPESPQSSGSST